MAANGKRSELQTVLRELARGLEKGVALARIYNDPEIFEAEKERIFARTYGYLAHESEIPNPGDYVVRYIADDSFIVVRDAQGQIRVLFNACSHRGMPLCRAERGRATSFVCPYHGWTFNSAGELIGVPAEQEGYGGRLDRSAWGLKPAPRVEIYDGLIFACLDPDAPSLREYLGGMAWYLDLLTKRSAAGLEVIGAPHRWVIDTNWKLPAENFISDAYHTLMTHHTMVELGLAPPDPKFAMYGFHVQAGEGHGLGIIGPPPHISLPPYWGYPEEIVRSLQQNYPSAAHVEVARRTNFLHGTIFPNLSILNVMLLKDPGSPPTPMLTFRLWRPLSPEKTEVWSWFLVERDAPSWFKELSYQTYVHTFGTSGVFEQDDAEVWCSITRAARGKMARRFWLNLQLGMHLRPDPTWPGPGTAYPLDYAEANERAFLRAWCRYMREEKPRSSRRRSSRRRS